MEVINLTLQQHEFVAKVFVDETYGETNDLDTCYEVIGEGLDANLNVMALAYESPYGISYLITHINLETYMDGEKIPNDFNPVLFKKILEIVV